MENSTQNIPSNQDFNFPLNWSQVLKDVTASWTCFEVVACAILRNRDFTSSAMLETLLDDLLTHLKEGD